MGTNYYLVDKKTKEKKHIGKNSCGWVFNFSTEISESWYKRQNSINNEKDFFIIDEYDRIITCGEMWAIITSQKDTGQRYKDNYTKIENGYMVSSGEFC